MADGLASVLCLLAAIDASSSAKDEGLKEMMNDDQHALKHTTDALLRQCKPANCFGASAELLMQIAADVSCFLSGCCAHFDLCMQAVLTRPRHWTQSALLLTSVPGSSQDCLHTQAKVCTVPGEGN